MGWFALIGAIRNDAGGWYTSSFDSEPDVVSLARTLADTNSAALVCFVYDSDIADIAVAGHDGTEARLVVNEETAQGYGMDFLPFGRSAQAAHELAEWARRYAPQPVDPASVQSVLETDHDFAEEGVIEIFELLGLPWAWDDPRKIGRADGD